MNTDFNEQLVENGYAYERIRLGNFEREIKGPIDYVERRMNETFEFIIAHRLELAASTQEEPVVVLPENDAPSLADDSAPVEQIISAEQTPIDLLTFYLKKSPKGQYEQVAVITYWYQRCKGSDSLETVSYDDYANAYAVLRRASVTMPTDVKGSVRNTHNRTEYIFSPSQGKFAMTIRGELLVKQLGTQA